MLIFRCSTTLFLPLSNLIVSVQNWKPPLSHFLLQLIYPQCDTISPLSLKLGLTSLTPTTQFPLTPQVAETILVRDWQKITDPYLIIDENVLEEVFSYSFVFSLLHIAFFSLFAPLSSISSFLLCLRSVSLYVTTWSTSLYFFVFSILVARDDTKTT